MIELKGITKSYKYKNVLNNINLELKEGEIVGILGPNAEGKSTLIKILAGHINDYTGVYLFNDRNFEPIYKEQIGYVSDKAILSKGWTVRDSVEYYDKYFNTFDKEKANMLLGRFGIDFRRKIKYLSKGESEKVHLALALSIKGVLYLLDEPLASVDIIGREEIMNTIVESFDEKSSMIIVSHLVRDVECILDRALFLKNGVFVSDVRVKEIREEGISLVDIYKNMYGFRY
ncbi:MAG: ATP-binding cassette domain-containing protein [Clostridium sp.]